MASTTLLVPAGVHSRRTKAEHTVFNQLSCRVGATEAHCQSASFLHPQAKGSRAAEHSNSLSSPSPQPPITTLAGELAAASSCNNVEVLKLEGTWGAAHLSAAEALHFF